MRPRRDDELAEALRRLGDAPEPEPGFESRVWARVAADDEARAAGGGSRTEGHAPRRFRPRRRLALAAAAAAAAALAVAAALFGLPGAGERTGPQPVSAAEVCARMTDAAASYRTLQGTMRFTFGEPDVVALGTFVADEAGSFSLRYDEGAWPAHLGDELSLPVTETYDARRHVTLFTYREPDGRLVSYGWDEQLPADGDGMTGWTVPYPVGCAWLVRAALADGDPTVAVESTVFDGRPAWSVVLPQTERFNYLAGMSFIVDQRTGFLVHWEAPADEDTARMSFLSTLSDLRVDEPLPDDAFSTAAPEGAKVTVEKNDYYCTLAQVQSRVGFRPFVPSRVPKGFALADVATDPRSAGELLGWQGPDPGSHDRHTEQFLRYRRGIDAFTVHAVSIVGVSKQEEADNWVGIEANPAYESAVLEGGAFHGRAAWTWFDQNGANLLVEGEDFVAMISGSLTRQELYEVAASLEQR